MIKRLRAAYWATVLTILHYICRRVLSKFQLANEISIDELIRWHDFTAISACLSGDPRTQQVYAFCCVTSKALVRLKNLEKDFDEMEIEGGTDEEEFIVFMPGCLDDSKLN